MTGQAVTDPDGTDSETSSFENSRTQPLRRRVLLLFLPFLSINLFLGYWAMAEIPESFPLESWLPLVYSLIVAAGFLWLWRKPESVLPVGVVVTIVIQLLFLGRVFSLVSGSAISDPDLPLFLPLYAYLPFAYFSMYLLLPLRLARGCSVVFWACVTAIVLWHLMPDWAQLEGRYGGISLLIYLIAANPMFIIMLEIIGRLDNELASTIKNLVGFRREVELRRQIERLGQRFKLAVMGSRDGLWEWPDLSRHEMWWSARTYDLLQLEPTETSATTDEFLKRVHPEDTPPLKEALKQAAGALNEDIQLEFRLQCGDDQYRWFTVRAVTVPGESGNQVRMAGSFRDIHRQKVAEMELTQSNAALDQFSRVAAHDLRAPLNRMTLTAGLVRRRRPELQEDADVARLLNMVDQQCKYMSELIDSLLSFSRTGTGQPPEPVDLNEVLAKVVDILQPEITSRDAEVKVEPLPCVLATEVEMTRVFQNLIGNSLKFNTGQPIVLVEGNLEGKLAKIRVWDNGIGISEDKVDEILRPMVRLHNQEEFPGHGLGLAAVHSIISRNNGQMRIKSKPGQGTTIHLTFVAPRDNQNHSN